MTITNVIALVVFAGTSGTALLVSYLHRKQMRQVEAFRNDPAVGLLPPLHPWTAFLRRHILVIWGVYLPFAGMVALLLWAPLNRTVAIFIFLNAAAMLVNLLQRSLSQRLETELDLYGWVSRHSDNIHQLLEGLNKNTYALDKLAEFVVAMDEASRKPEP
jgi:hypothetical protein